MSAKNDPGCAVGRRAEEIAPSRLLMTLLTSIPPSLVLSPLSRGNSLLLFHPPTQPIYFLRVAQHRNRCRVDPCCPFSSSEFLTITSGLTQDKSNGPTCLLWLCAAPANRWASQLIPFIFLGRAVDCFVADVGARRLLSCGRDQGSGPPRGLPVDRRLFKVIRVTVRGIDSPLLLLCLPDGRPRSALSDSARLNGKNIGLDRRIK